MKKAMIIAGVILLASVSLTSCKPDFCDCVNIKRSSDPVESQLNICNEAYKDMPREEQMVRFIKWIYYFLSSVFKCKLMIKFK